MDAFSGAIANCIEYAMRMTNIFLGFRAHFKPNSILSCRKLIIFVVKQFGFSLAGKQIDDL